MLQDFISGKIVEIKTVPFSGACIVGLFEYLSTLMLTCAQFGRVSRIERKTVPTSGARSSRKGLKENNNRVLGVINNFCIPFGTESTTSICGGGGGLNSVCTVATLHRVANIRMKHLNSDTERARGEYFFLYYNLYCLF